MSLKTKNISERAYQHIRETLLSSGAYVNQKIPHQEIGHKLGISSTPLREALFRLAAEGLLEHRNYKGFSIPAISMAEAEEIYEVREIIEPVLAAKAAGTMTDDALEKFDQIQDAYGDMASKPYHRQRLLIDKQFHLHFARVVENGTLTHTLNQLYDKLIFKSPIYEVSLDRAKAAILEHQRIIHALRSRDSQRTARLMREHIRNQREFVLERISVSQETRNLGAMSALR